MNRKLSRTARASSRAIVSIAFALGSCSSILGVDDYKDSTGELCDLLHACYDYKGCEARIGTRLEQASATDRTLWLASISDKACLDQCSAARRCLNIKPVCNSIGQLCERKEDCCGFLGGKAKCGGPSEGPKQCCKAAGAQCNSKENECCSDVPCDPHTGTCAGVICSSENQLCNNDFDCCSGFCRNNHCRDEICTEVGSTCNKDTDTCCDNSQCLDGVCGYRPDCRDEGQKCLVDSSEHPEWKCCSGTCVPYAKQIIPEISATEVLVGICRQQECLPENLTCEISPCCPDLYCDPYKHQCGQRCGAPDSSCQNDWECCSNTCVGGTCDCSLGACVDNDDCCSRICIGGACAPTCNALDNTCHNVCQVGAPLNGQLCLVNGSPLEQTVCAKDAYCCCVEWDDTCVNETILKFGDSVCF